MSRANNLQPYPNLLPRIQYRESHWYHRRRHGSFSGSVRSWRPRLYALQFAVSCRFSRGHDFPLSSAGVLVEGMAWSFPLLFGCLLGRTFPVSFTRQDVSDLALALLAGSARLALSRFGLEIWLMLHGRVFFAQAFRILILLHDIVLSSYAHLSPIILRLLLSIFRKWLVIFSPHLHISPHCISHADAYGNFFPYFRFSFSSLSISSLQ